MDEGAGRIGGYELYRATSPSGAYKLIKSTAAPFYVNGGLATGTEYFYKVRAYRKVGGRTIYSDYTDPISAKPTLSGS